MRITPAGSFLTQLTRFGLINVYLVREYDGFTLIDTGIGGSAPAILNAARTLGAPIRRILLTHAHGDHVGSVDALHTLLPDAELLISAREARLLNGDQTLDPGEAHVPLRGSFQPISTPVARALSDGDTVGSLQVVAAPGHTPGHIALYDPRDGSLIAGDAFQTAGGVAVAGVLRPLFPLPALATWDLPTALESARHLLDLNPSRLAIGHGRVLEAPQEAIRRAIGGAERTVGRVQAQA
ncbi:MBL fold metallo-hydrolase (plasmid) [Deinococcus sp. KNUC1210]|uniref:MBL fold metallo-hydrolase n=1 Tax=Deinococcus sp. KNUC1210 TaxID=2917691 RepID=UPI001EF02B12|nr:MBL fold metallo-hydrolase [Deinococcus sp. KNUC1210]ULH14000.1 MBL fold metallo-hydrolase [Deinococcus sp. KNUC1210]